MLETLISSKTRIKLLLKFFLNSNARGYLRSLESEFGESTNAIRKELNHLQGAGYLEKVRVDNKVEYKANIKHPLFKVMQKVVFKHLGLEDVVETVLERMGEVDQIILVGDYAKGNDSGLIEVFLIGQGLNMEYIAQLENKIEDLIGRKVSFYLASKFLAEREHIVLFNSKEK